MDITPFIIPLKYTFDGFLGAIIYILVQKYGWQDEPAIIRQLLMGMIGGYIVYLAGLPDSITAIAFGYMGIDAIGAILKKASPPVPKSA